MQKIVVLAHDEDLMDRIARAMEHTASCIHVDPVQGNALALIETVAPDLMVVEATSTYAGTSSALFDQIAALRESHPDKPIVGIGDELAAQTVLLAMRAGANDFLERDSSIEEMRTQLSAHLKRKLRKHGAENEARLTVVMAGRPDENEAHLAVNVAVQKALSNKGGDEVVLVDLCLPSSEAAIGLDLKPTYTCRDALDDLLRLDKTLMTSALARHEPSGLLMLPLTVGPEDVSDLRPADILSMIFMLRAMFREIVLNVGHLRHSPMLAQLLQPAGTVLVVTTQHFASVKSCADLFRMHDLADQLDERFHLVVAEYDERIDITEAQIAETLGIPNASRLPCARADLINAFNSGTPVCQRRPDGAYCRALRQLIGLAEGAEAADGGMVTRLLAKLGLA